MKKIKFLLPVLFCTQFFSAQYMMVGKDSVSLSDFKKENAAGLKSTGVEKTVKAAQNFLLMQQFAKSHKADTANYFRTAINQKILELRDQKFYPSAIVEPVLKSYVNDLQKEIKVQVFAVPKQIGDTKNYKSVYEQVKKGEISMETAVKSYTDATGEPFYLKPGILSPERYNSIKSLAPSSYSEFYEDANSYLFIKVLGSRPSLGYLVFGSISYPKDAQADLRRTQIYNALKSGKEFTEVAGEFGADEKEKQTAGLVLGSPTLPDEVYQALKNKKAGDYSEPILMDGKYFVFYIFDKRNYDLTEETEAFLKREMMNSSYKDLIIRKLVEHEKRSNKYTELPAFASVRSSFASFKNFSNPASLLLQYGTHTLSFGEMKKNLGDDFKEVKEIGVAEWQRIVDILSSGFVYQKYSEDFVNSPEIKNELDHYKQTLYSSYIFTYLKGEMDKNPKRLRDYYNNNKTKYQHEAAAKGRIAILSDVSLLNEIKKEIENPKNWEALKARYANRLNSKNQVLVDFKDGEMPADAEIFSTYKVPFKKGLGSAKIGDRYLVVAIDGILPASTMSFEEAQDFVRDDLREQMLQDLISKQREKTQIVVQPAFISDLERNFKK